MRFTTVPIAIGLNFFRANADLKTENFFDANLRTTNFIVQKCSKLHVLKMLVKNWESSIYKYEKGCFAILQLNTSAIKEALKPPSNLPVT